MFYVDSEQGEYWSIHETLEKASKAFDAIPPEGGSRILYEDTETGLLLTVKEDK